MTDSDAHTRQTPLAGRRAAITGGTTGIGRAIAVLLASEGAEVFICGRDPEHLDDALERINQVGKGGGIAIDLAEADNVGRFFDAAEAAMGGFDIAIVNAAVAGEGITDTDGATLRTIIATNFTAYLLSAHHAAERVGSEGDIVFIGSTSAYALGPGSTIYAGIKYGIQGFTIALRRELGPKGIRVSNVEPGLTGSDMQLPDIQPDEQRERIGEEKMLRADDIAVGVQYLLTQPRRAVVQQLTIVPREQADE